MGRLGCLDTIEAIVTDQCGGPRICSLTNISSVSWNRILDEISEAVVEVPVATGIGSNPCCECMGDIEPWCHELQIIRNGQLVWTGPIIRITSGYVNRVSVNRVDRGSKSSTSTGNRVVVNYNRPGENVRICWRTQTSNV